MHFWAPHSLSWEKQILICIHIWALRLHMRANSRWGEGQVFADDAASHPLLIWLHLPVAETFRAEVGPGRVYVLPSAGPVPPPILPRPPPDYSLAPKEIKLCDKIKWPGLRCMCRNCQYQPWCTQPFGDTFTSSAGSRRGRKKQGVGGQQKLGSQVLIKEAESCVVGIQD